MMQRIFSCGLAAIAAIWFTPSVYAGGAGGVGGSFGSAASVSALGGHAGGSSGIHSSGAVAHFSSSSAGGHAYHSSNFATHFGAGASAVAIPPVFHASTAAALAIAHARTAAAPVVNVNRAFAPAPTSDPTLAFGGSTTVLRGGGRAFSPSRDVTQNWDRNRSHTWNHHRYRYHHGAWIYWDYGFPYDDDFAGTDNDQPPYPPYPYPPPANGVVDDSQPTTNGSASNDQPSANQSLASDGGDYGTPDTLIVSVQDALTRRGYATGAADGRFGSMTETALSNFQRDQKLPITGRIDGRTLQALGLL